MIVTPCDVSSFQAGWWQSGGLPGVGRSLEYPEEVPGLFVPYLSHEQVRLAEAVLGGGQEVDGEDRPSLAEETSRE